MSRVLAFFQEEAADQLAGMRAGLQDDNAVELRRHARVLRGSAQMARQEEIQQLAAVVEQTARRLADGGLDWSGAVRGELSDAIAMLERRVLDAKEQAQWTESEGVVVDQEIVPIQELLYEGGRALDRAGELRVALEQYIGDPEGLELLAELFDLIELGRA